MSVPDTSYSLAKLMGLYFENLKLLKTSMGLKTPIQISEDDVWEIDILRKGYVSPKSVGKKCTIMFD